MSELHGRGNGNGNGKTDLMRSALDGLKGPAFGNIMSAGILLAVGYGIYGGVPYVLDRIDKMVSGIDSTVQKIEDKHALIEKANSDAHREEQKETRTAFTAIEARQDDWHKAQAEQIDKTQKTLEEILRSQNESTNALKEMKRGGGT